LWDDFVAEEAGFLEGIFVVMLEEKVEVFESGVEFVGVFDGFIEELFGGGFVELFERGAGLSDLVLEAVSSGEDLSAPHFEHEAGFDEEGAVVLFDEDVGSAFEFARGEDVVLFKECDACGISVSGESVDSGFEVG